MLTSKDYTTMTLEELVSEKKKMASQKNITAVLMGVLIGIGIWSATHNGGFLTYILLFSAILIGRKHSQDKRNLEAEITRRNKAG